MDKFSNTSDSKTDPLVVNDQKDLEVKVTLDKTPLDQQIFLEWTDLNYYIKQKPPKEVKKVDDFSKLKTSPDDDEEEQVDPTKKYILRNINGFAKPKEILAIMGPSGSGKTTLLNVIADRQLPNNKDHIIDKNIKANGVNVNNDNFGQVCAYIMQDDILLDCLTVKESLLFAARLKLNTSYEDCEKRANELIRQFGLTKCQDNIIGSTLVRGISGGERKRTSIAYELISNPAIVIVDEPTTGMDSFTSLILLKYLSELAKLGKTIICTIHQPGSEIFQYLDRLILLKDGYIAYQGPIQNTNEYFKVIGHEMPEFCNPFDHFIDVISLPDKSGFELNKKYKSLALQEVQEELTTNHEKHKSYGGLIHDIQELRRVNWSLEFYLLTVRSLKNYTRNTTAFLARIFQVFFNTFLLSIFFFGIGDQTDPSILLQNFTGFLFNCDNNFFINGMFTTILYIPTIGPILKREYSAKLYRISPFFLAQIITMLLPCLIYTFVFSISTYFCIKLKTDFETFWLFLFLNFLNYMLGALLGFVLGTAINEQVVFSIAPFIFIIFMLGSGFYNSNDSFPKFMVWVNYISPYKYTMELYLRAEASFNMMTARIPELLSYTNGYGVCYGVVLGMYAFLFIIEFPLLYKFARRY